MTQNQNHIEETIGRTFGNGFEMIAAVAIPENDDMLILAQRPDSTCTCEYAVSFWALGAPDWDSGSYFRSPAAAWQRFAELLLSERSDWR